MRYNKFIKFTNSVAWLESLFMSLRRRELHNTSDFDTIEKYN